jgi:hypothetical protein
MENVTSNASKSSNTSENESKSDFLKFGNFDFKKLIRDTLFINGVLLLIIGLQGLFIPLNAGVIYDEYGFMLYFFLLIGLTSILSGVFFNRDIVAKLNVGFIFILLGLNIAFLLFFSGILTPILNVIIVFGIILTIMAFCINLMVLLNDRDNAIKAFKKVIFSQIIPKKKQALVALGIIVLVVGIGSFTSWGRTYTIKADDDFGTISSYWGPPRNDNTDATRIVTPLDSTTLLVHNSTLNETVKKYATDSFCYVKYVHIGTDTKNYCDYSSGAESYPNGTVKLSEPLTNLNNVEISFVYRYDISVFADLHTSNSTLQMNYLNEKDDFVEFSNIFERINRTYLFQLLDWWDVKYYIDIGISSILFPHVFNYPLSVARSNQTLLWASTATSGIGGPKALTNMVGISLDFESSNKSNPAYNELQNYEMQPIGGIIPYKDWIGDNEQNRTLYAEAIQAWENVYTLTSSLGYKFYAVFQGDAMIDTIDGDLDITRLPTYPISPNKDVQYGIMCYQDSNSDTGRYHVYKDCLNQITIYGDQGDTILMGWLSATARYYTSDDAGLENYINDCKIAQAAGMKEIYHSPLYRMQAMWGNDAILKIHNALNNDTKQEIVIRAPEIYDYKMGIMNDYIQNLDRLAFFIPVMIYIALQIALSTFGLAKRKK